MESQNDVPTWVQKLKEMRETFESVRDGESFFQAKQAVHNDYEDVHLGSGIERDVYALDDEHVVKFGASIQNECEARRWETADDKLKSLLCPVVGVDEERHHWIVMKRAEIPTHEYKKIHLTSVLVLETGGEIGEVQKRGDDLSFSFDWGKINDLHQDNVGELDGEPVIVDYGFE